MKDDSSNNQDIKIIDTEVKVDDIKNENDMPPASDNSTTSLPPESEAQYESEPLSASSQDNNLDGLSSNSSFSSVAASPSSKKLLIIGIILAASTGIYFIFKGAKEDNFVEKTPTEKIQERSEEAKKLIKEAKPVATPERVQITQAPKLPAAPPIQAPQPPEPPPPPVPAAPLAPVFPQNVNRTSVGSQPSAVQTFNPSTGVSIDPFGSKEDEQIRLKALEARRKSAIMVVGGGGNSFGSSKDNKNSEDKDKDKDGEKKDRSTFLGFGEGAFGETAIGKTKFTQVKATQIGRLDNLIAQGKIINAILETAINTDLPGTLRAIISRDVYAESGNAVLVPKGSRVIGTYEAQVKAGQTRVAVIWNRLIRPDGIDVALDSPGSDTLGRSGVPGFLDNKFLTKLGNALLISYVVPQIAERIFKANSSNNTPITNSSTTNPATGSVTTTSTSTFKQQQLKESQDKFNEVMSKAIQDSFSTTPTIYVDQGSEVNIFVNKDLVFPANTMIGATQFIK